MIHGHQDTADITAGPHASAVYDIITSPPALDEQDTSYDARYDIVKHAPAHQKTTPPDSTPTAALYDVLKHAAPASRKIRAKRAVPDPILSACYSTINVPIVPPRLGVAVSPPAGDRMDAAIPTAEVCSHKFSGHKQLAEAYLSAPPISASRVVMTTPAYCSGTFH